MFRRGVTLSSTLYPRAGFSFPKESQVSNHCRALLRGGLLRDGSSPGTNAMMPLGQRVIDKISACIDGEMSRINAHRLSLPILTNSSIMKKSERWDEFGKSLFQVKDSSGRLSCLAPTHEEAITALLSTHQTELSYHDLPIRLYQIGPKFRDESHTGLLRTREFLMKDLYSFDTDLENARKTFELVTQAYHRIFTSLQLPYMQVSGDVGLMGGHASSEFQALSASGEDTIRVCSKCGGAWNSEMEDSQGTCDGGCTVEEKRSIEIGHCFLLGTKYSEQFETHYAAKDESLRLCVMGCFGIGVTRLLATIVDTHWSDKHDHLVWPKAFAPHSVTVTSLGKPRAERLEVARSIAERLTNCLHTDVDTGRPHLLCEGDVLLDDRLWWPDGMRLKEAEILGSPYLVIVGKKSGEGIYELQFQPSRKSELHTLDGLVARLSHLMAIDQGLLPADSADEV